MQPELHLFVRCQGGSTILSTDEETEALRSDTS